jgi:conjugal transfer/entry exclusion protein
MKDKELLLYSKLITLRNLLKEVQQLSWDITQLDKKFPIARAEQMDTYESLISVYLNFSDRIESIASEFRETVYDNGVIENIKMKKLNQNENKNISDEIL